MSPAAAVTGGRLQFRQGKQDQVLLADACVSAVARRADQIGKNDSIETSSLPPPPAIYRNTACF